MPRKKPKFRNGQVVMPKHDDPGKIVARKFFSQWTYQFKDGRVFEEQDLRSLTNHERSGD